MTPKQQAAMQQALEALEIMIGYQIDERNPYAVICDALDSLREALAEPVQEPYDQSALELCEECGWKTVIPDDGCLNCARLQKQEPVAFSQFLTDVVTAAGLLSHGKTDKALARRISDFAFHLRTAPQPTKPAEPVQEPVAWNWMLDGRPYGQAYYGNPPDADIAERAAISGRTVRLLYANPPQRKPLTDEEIDRITDQQWAANNHKPVYAAHRAYARAVEAAHEIAGEDT